MNLSNRLLSLVKYFESNDIIADIGCDHAYLSIYLILNNLIKKSYISDINEGALNNGIKNIKKHHLEAQIKAILSDGIKDIEKDVNTLIISGMGANTIIKILNDDKLKQIDKIIIQSNNDHDLIRKYLTNMNYYIFAEDIVKDNDKYYINIVFKKGNKKYSFLDLKYGPILRKNNKEYFKNLYKKEKEIYMKIPKKRVGNKYQKLKELIYLKLIIIG